MTTLYRGARRALAVMALGTLSACSQAGSLGNILGSVLGSGGGQVSGVVTNVDTRAQQVSIQQSNGQTVALSYDNQTKVVYNNQNYAVTSLDRGDQVTANVQSNGSNGYYTDVITVVQPAQGSGSTTGSTTGNVQLLQGTVRTVDQNNGWFNLDVSGYGLITVSLPYNVSSTDLQRFRNLRSGDSVRLYGVFLNNTRVELRQFY